MFNIGFWEIVVIGVIALLVLGPDQLPSLARMVGKFTGDLKRATDEFKSDFASTTKETRQVVDDLKSSVQKSINESIQPINEALSHHEFHGPDGNPIPNPHLNGHHHHEAVSNDDGQLSFPKEPTPGTSVDEALDEKTMPINVGDNSDEKSNKS